jgi:hypothetical protein
MEKEKGPRRSLNNNQEAQLKLSTDQQRDERSSAHPHSTGQRSTDPKTDHPDTSDQGKEEGTNKNHPLIIHADLTAQTAMDDTNVLINRHIERMTAHLCDGAYECDSSCKSRVKKLERRLKKLHRIGFKLLEQVYVFHKGVEDFREPRASEFDRGYEDQYESLMTDTKDLVAQGIAKKNRLEREFEADLLTAMENTLKLPGSSKEVNLELAKDREDKRERLEAFLDDYFRSQHSQYAQAQETVEKMISNLRRESEEMGRRLVATLQEHQDIERMVREADLEADHEFFALLD